MDEATRTWFVAQMERYGLVKATYEQLSMTLVKVLEQICRKVAPGAKTDGRAKTEASFGEKILKKRNEKRYGDDPFAHITDLAGARAIVYSLDQVRAVCRAIEALDGHGLRIDWKNSVDTRRELGTDRFRYAAVHYIVEFTGKKKLHDIMPNNEICAIGKRHLCAEIQVCTFLQHVWSSIGHDRVYKPELKPPPQLERELNAVSALLESADNAFARAIHDLDAYAEEFDVCLTATQLENEIDKWREVVALCPTSHAAAHKLGKRLLAAERWDEACAVLDEIQNTAGGDAADQPAEDHRVKLDQAQGALRCGRTEMGRELLKKIVDADTGNTRAISLLGYSYLQNGELEEARQWLGKAFDQTSDEPSVLAPYMEYLLRRQDRLRPVPADLRAMQGTLKAAIHQCEARAARGVYLPEGHFNRGRFFLLLGDAYASMTPADGDQPDHMYAAFDAYCRGIAASPTCTPIEDELAALERILKDRCPNIFDEHDKLCMDPDWEGIELARMLLTVGLVGKAAQLAASGSASAAQRLEQHRQKLLLLRSHPVDDRVPEPKTWPAPIVIVAGGCDAKFGPQLVTTYGALFNEAFRSFSGTIIGGGTTAGVSGLVASLPEKDSCKKLKIGYLPPKLPDGDLIAAEYKVRRTFGLSGKSDYSKAGPIQTWADLLSEPGINPVQVRLLGIDGGKISGFEFRLAVALGAKVGVVVDSQRAVKTLLEDESWKQLEGTVPLPTDAATWAVFVRGTSPALDGLSPEVVEKAAAFVHEEYRKTTDGNPKKHHASVLPWDNGLSEEFKQSNRHQVQYAQLILAEVGYDVCPARGALNVDNPPIPTGYLEKDNIEEMAELEHGRFCAERLSHGWRYGRTNDPGKKINDTLIEWAKLPPEIKEYDRSAVRNFPRWLAQAGLVIVKR